MQLFRLAGSKDPAYVRHWPTYVDPSRRIVDELNPDVRGSGHRVRQAIRPFDGEHAVAHPHFLQPEIVGGGTLQTEEICVVQCQPPAAIFVDQRERRAAHLARIDAEALRDPADERGLPRAKMTRQQHDVARPQVPREPPGERDRFLFRTGDVDQDGFSTFLRPVSSPSASPRCPSRSEAIIDTSPWLASARSPAAP